MNPLLSLALTIAMSASTFAADATFYLGKLDTETGKLGAVELAGEAKSPSFVALSPNRKFLYAAFEDDGAVGAFSVGADGKLTALNSTPCGGGTCHVWV